MTVLTLALALWACTGLESTKDAPSTWEETEATTGAGTATETHVPDRDADGVPDVEDDCPDDPLNWTDVDGDGHCDQADDPCADDPANWSDADGDGWCDQTQDDCPDDGLGWTDADGDGWCDEALDDCPDDPLGHADTNGDGLCDGRDDADGDGLTGDEELALGADCAVSDPETPDTDGDGLADGADPFPLDRWPDFVLVPDDQGTIGMQLSNGDGTFSPPTAIGLPYGGTTNTAYRYIHVAVSDFDGDGQVDFLATGDPTPDDDEDPVDLWAFVRLDDAVWQQVYLGTTARSPLNEIVADLDGDGVADLAVLDKDGSTYPSRAVEIAYLNTGLFASASCAVTRDPANPDGCAFVEVEAVDLTWRADGGNWAYGAYQFKASKMAVDLTGDGHLDLLSIRYKGGGDAPVQVGLSRGRGDGTFEPVVEPWFTFNDGACGASPANAIGVTDIDGDGVGDLFIGLDDDGDPGSLWVIPGRLQGDGGIEPDLGACYEAFDLVAVESGGDGPGSTGKVLPWDVDHDGWNDIVLGWNHVNQGAPPTMAEVHLNDHGVFSLPGIGFAESTDSNAAKRFGFPRRACPTPAAGW